MNDLLDNSGIALLDDSGNVLTIGISVDLLGIFESIENADGSPNYIVDRLGNYIIDQFGDYVTSVNGIVFVGSLGETSGSLSIEEQEDIATFQGKSSRVIKFVLRGEIEIQ